MRNQLLIGCRKCLLKKWYHVIVITSSLILIIILFQSRIKQQGSNAIPIPVCKWLRNNDDVMVVLIFPKKVKNVGVFREEKKVINRVETNTSFDFDLVQQLMVSDSTPCPLKEGFHYANVRHILRHHLYPLHTFTLSFTTYVIIFVIISTLFRHFFVIFSSCGIAIYAITDVIHTGIIIYHTATAHHIAIFVWLQHPKQIEKLVFCKCWAQRIQTSY